MSSFSLNDRVRIGRRNLAERERRFRDFPVEVRHAAMRGYRNWRAVVCSDSPEWGGDGRHEHRHADHTFVHVSATTPGGMSGWWNVRDLERAVD